MQDSDTVLVEAEAEKDWIEAPGGWGGEDSTSASTSTSIPSSSSSPNDDDDESSSSFDLFANVDKSLKFPFDVLTTTTTKDSDKISATIKKRLYLSGYKLDSDETAQSTGVTLWNAAPRLAKYIMNHDNDNNHEHKHNEHEHNEHNHEHEHEQDEGKVKEENENENRNMKMLITGKRVLELGSGLGLCGIVAYHIGANYVMMTDADTITLEKMRFNVTHNCCSTFTSTDTESGIATSSDSSRTSSSIDCKQLIWNEQLETFHQKYGNWDTILGADVIYTRESLEPLFDTVLFFLVQHQLENKNKSSSVVGRFILSRYNKWGDISDETVLDAAMARNLIWTQTSEGIFVFQLKIIK